MLIRIFAQITKELTQILRDRLALTLAIVLPLILLILMGNAISLTPTDLPIVVQDFDQSPLSRQFIEAFRSSLTFQIVPLPSGHSPEQEMIASRARAALIIPPDFSRNVLRHRPVEAQMLIDATDSNTATQIRGYTSMITLAFARRLAGPAPPAGIRPEVRLWYNPGRSSPRFYGPGVFVLVLSIFPPMLAALAMSREGEQKTIQQVYVSSISAFEFVIGKVIAYMIVGLAEWTALLFVLFTVFSLRFAGDPTPFLASTILFLFCVVSFGALVGGAIPNQAAAIQAVSLGGFLLAFLLSGFIFPVQNIPAGLRWISSFVQSRYYIEIVRDVFLQGGGWPATWSKVAMLGLLGLIYFLLAWLSQRRMQVNA